jgi:hypothetical protein
MDLIKKINFDFWFLGLIGCYNSLITFVLFLSHTFSQTAPQFKICYFELEALYSVTLLLLGSYIYIYISEYSIGNKKNIISYNKTLKRTEPTFLHPDQILNIPILKSLNLNK